MQNLPIADIYVKEFIFTPWGKLTDEVISYLADSANRDAKLLDLMCGPGYLLGKLAERRPDITCVGIDLDREFIVHAKKSHPGIQFLEADVLELDTHEKFDVITCTAGVHHLPYESQRPLLCKISKMLAGDGFAVIADPYIGNYDSEKERLLAGAKLGYEYLVATIENDATPDVLDAAIQILRNDILQVEWKTSAKKNLVTLKECFKYVEMHKTWPDQETNYGDYYFVLKN